MTTEAISASTLTSVVARVLLGVLAVLVIAWAGVLLRDLEVGKDAVASRNAGRLEWALLRRAVRIASLLPSATEIVGALGALPELVGRS